jgi:hypothetical protein
MYPRLFLFKRDSATPCITKQSARCTQYVTWMEMDSDIEYIGIAIIARVQSF